MRIACGLPPRDRRKDERPGMGAVAIADSSQEDGGETSRKGFLLVHGAVIEHLFQKCQDCGAMRLYCAASLFTSFALILFKVVRVLSSQ